MKVIRPKTRGSRGKSVAPPVTVKSATRSRRSSTPLSTTSRSRSGSTPAREPVSRKVRTATVTPVKRSHKKKLVTSSSSSQRSVPLKDAKSSPAKKIPIHPSRRKGHVPGTDSWEVEEIVDYRMSPGMRTEDVAGAKPTLYFAVKWVGYGEEDINLEPIDHLVDSISLVKQFLKKKGKTLVIDKEKQEASVVDMKRKTR